MTLSDVNDLHACSALVAAEGCESHVVDWPEVAELARTIRAFKETVEVHNLQTYCDSLLIQIESFHAHVARSPFSPEACFSFQPDLSAEIARVSDRSPNFDPGAKAAFDRMRESLSTVASIKTSAIAQMTRGLLDNSRNSTAVVVVPNPPGRALLEELRSIEIRRAAEAMGVTAPDSQVKLLMPGELRDARCVDRLMIFGPLWKLRWKKLEFLVRSPLAPSIQIIRCKHENIGSEVVSLLDDESLLRVNGVENAPLDLISDIQLIGDEWGQRLHRAKTAYETSNQTDDEQQVISVPVKYAGGKAEFLPAEHRVVVLRIHDRRCMEVEKILPGNLLEGDYVFRATGGTDSDITPAFADQLLGQRAAELRQIQLSWKTALRKKISATGRGNTIGLLRQAGCAALTYTNVRNWQNPRNIAPEDLEHSLMAILKVVGMDSQYTKIARASRQLRKAHQIAGRRLHQLVYRRLKREDLTELCISGRQEVRDSEHGPAKTAFRVLATEQASHVSAHLTGQLFDVGEEEELQHV